MPQAIEPAVGRTNVIMCLDYAHVASVLNQFNLCKSEQPADTDAYLICPRLPNAPWSPQLKGTVPIATLQLSELSKQPVPVESDIKCQVFYSPCKAAPGCVQTETLPAAVRRLCTMASAKPQHTFVFDGKVAGVPCSILWDSGAVVSFVSREFIRTHRIATSPSSAAIQLADGSVVESLGSSKLKLQIQGHRTTLSLVVTDLLPGYDVILGEDWSKANAVQAQYGTPSLHGEAPGPPKLTLVKSQCRLYPSTAYAVEPTPAKDRVMTAAAAAKLLRTPKFGSASPFVVLTRKLDDAEPAAESRNDRLQSLLAEYQDVFQSPSLTGTGASSLGDLTPECIPIIPGSVPHNRPPFRLSPKEKAEIESQVREALANGWIEQSSSAYGAPVLFVPKPDGSLRMCIDYRGLNKLTVKNKFPMPRIDDLIDNLSGATHFSTLDLAAGYHQLKLQATDVPKTAFNTHFGKFEWRVLPFGLTNAPAVFQHAMNRIFGKHLNKCVCVYLDDILIFSRSEEEHFQHLEMVLQLLRENKLCAKHKKCEFFKPELKYLGHMVSATGIKPDPSKIQTLSDWPRPAGVNEVRQFLGLANYFRKFIRGYAATVAPLTDLLKGLSKQERVGVRQRRRVSAEDTRAMADRFAQRWSPACDAAFAAVKAALTSAPVLALPDPGKHFTLVSDACDSPPALGAVLMQDGHPVSYYSRKLSGPELNYSTSDKEMLAVICALREWRCYLEGATFTIVTDHQPNTYLDVTTSAHTLKRRARWLDVACGYSYTWRYRPGRTNVADPLSRAPQHFAVMQPTVTMAMQLSRHAASADALPSPHCCALCAIKSAGLTRRAAARDAGAVGGARRAQGLHTSDGGDDTTQGSHDNNSAASEQADASYPAGSADDEIAASSYALRNFVQRFNRSYEQDRVVSPASFDYAKLKKDANGLHWTSANHLAVPGFDNLRKEMFESVHVHPFSGHYGLKRTLEKAKKLYFWPGIAADIKRWCQECDSCQRVKAERAKPKGTLQPLDTPERRWESVSMDLITDLPTTSKGNDAIFVVVDRLSKMVHIEAVQKSISAKGLAAVYTDRVFRYHGVPQSIVSDRDPRFTSLFWRELAKRLGTELRMSTAYHPQTDGQTERVNGVLEDTLRHFVGPYQNDWDDLLAPAEFAMNNSWHHSIRNTPFMLNYGQNPDDPTVAKLRSLNPAINAFVGKWSDQLSRAKLCLEAAQQRMKHYADQKRRATPAFKVGDQVLLNIKNFRLQSGLCRKLAPRYLGPFKIVQVVGSGKLAVKLDLPADLRIHPVFHVSALKAYNHFGGNYQPPPLPALVDGHLEFEVDCISNTRKEGKQREYRVHWAGYQEATWENVKNLTNCPDKLRDFWEAKGMPCPHTIPR